MKQYTVLRREIHVSHVQLYAPSAEEAVERVKDGEGSEIKLEYSITPDDGDTVHQYWEVSEIKYLPSPILMLALSRDEHLSKARAYETGGNAQGAAQLRAVANLLQAIIDGKEPQTVLP